MKIHSPSPQASTSRAASDRSDLADLLSYLRGHERRVVALRRIAEKPGLPAQHYGLKRAGKDPLQSQSLDGLVRIGAVTTTRTHQPTVTRYRPSRLGLEALRIMCPDADIPPPPVGIVTGLNNVSLAAPPWGAP